MHILLIMLLLLLNIKKKSWQKIRQCLPGITYVLFFNALYYLICRKSSFWEFQSPRANGTFLKKIHFFIVMPLLVMAFLATFPKKLFEQAIYIGKWVGISTFIEWAGIKFKAIVHQKGWTVGWSAMIYFFMYMFSAAVHKRPLLVMTLSFFMTAGMLYVFQVPINKSVIFRKPFTSIR
ncbi:CBO0543 family protein [Thalassobacillus pellis]|uniref:CBO0543 family protein n=1 Tax=Thalassobacillus pellis TaxID=748008 RepID=UPI001961FE6E|nr:CBO0543 family protein [Thalassobacillus pellis]MBM7553483.1 hypothetical protein [Thalassobacillus pellis]